MEDERMEEKERKREEERDVCKMCAYQTLPIFLLRSIQYERMNSYQGRQVYRRLQEEEGKREASEGTE